MWTTVALFVFGLFLLYWGGDLLVDSAVALARRLRVSQVLIGTTIVSIGTTIPEITVSSLASLRGEAGIAYGNALGSVICNSALIGGALFLLAPSIISRLEIRMGTMYFFASLLVVLCFALGSGMDLVPGLLLLAMFVVFMGLNLRSARKNVGKEEVGKAEREENSPVWRILLALLLGSGLIFLGSNLLINNGVILASAMGVPQHVIALTFIAFGTSLPELVTAVTAIVKRHGGISLGNIIGANIINLTVVLGLSSAIAPILIPRDTLCIDVLLAEAVMLCLTLPVLSRERTYRLQGLALLAAYALYVFWLFGGNLSATIAQVFSPYLSTH